MITVSTTVGTRGRLRVPTAARGRGAAPAGLVVALVVGILGMHALTSHGTHPSPAAVSDSMSMSGTTSALHSAMSSTDSHEGHGRAAASHSSNAATGTAADPGSGSGHDLARMVMLCVVMLAAAALRLLALLAVGFFRPLGPVAFLPADVRERPVQWVRGTGPPAVWRFSVVRC